MTRVLIALGVCLTGLAGCRSTEPETPSAAAQPGATDRSLGDEPGATAQPTAAGEPTADVEPSLLDQVSMLPSQRRYSHTLLRNFRRDFAPYDDCRARLVAEIAAEVRLGQTERPKLEPLIEECTTIWEERKHVMMHFLDALHAMLSTAQRKRVVALAYGEDAPEDAGLSEHERIRKDQQGMLEALDLSAGQAARLFPPLLGVYFRYMGPIGDLRRSMRETKDAFISPDFESANLAFFAVDWRPLAQAILDAGEVFLRVLEPEQRQTLATLIEKRW